MVRKAKERHNDRGGQEMLTESLTKLLGLPGLSDYLHFTRTRVVGGNAIAARTLVDEWRRANDHYHEIEQAETGLADQIETLPLPKSLTARRRAVRAHPFFKQSFDELPVAIKMVELRHLVASQHSVGDGYSHGIAKTLGKHPTDAALFDFCLPLKRDNAPFEVKRLGDDHYLFVSGSTDFRYHNTELVAPNQIGSLQSFGPIGGALVLPVGYGSNLLSAVQSEKRIVLQNGYHRAFALLSMGITHAPMIVQTVTRSDELYLAASSEVSDRAAFYFRSARPPLLKDFLDPLLTKKVHIHRLETRVEIDIKVRTSTGPVARSL